MNLDWLIFGLAVLTAVNYWFRRSVVYPPFLFCGMWLLDTLIYRIGLSDLYSLHTITCYVVFAGAVVFSLGGALGFLVPHGLLARRITVFGNPKTSGKWIVRVILILLVIGLINNVRNAISVAGGITTANGVFWAAAAKVSVDELNANGGSVQVGNYISNWAIFMAVLLLSERYSRLGLVVAGLAFVSGIVSGGRGALFLLVSALITIYLIKTKRESLSAARRSVQIPVISFVALFIVLFFVNKGVQTNGESVFVMARDVMMQYIVGGMAALDYVLVHMGDYQHLPNHTFQLFLKVASSFGVISYTPPPPLDEWVFIPFGTNVYTIYKPYIVDFGIYAGVGWMCLIGFAHTVLFRKAHTNSILGRYIFALTVYSVFMVIFDDEYSRFGMYGSALLLGVFYLMVRSIPGRIFRPATVEAQSSGRRFPKVRWLRPVPMLRLRLRQRRSE